MGTPQNSQVELFGVQVGREGWGESLFSHAFLTPKGVEGLGNKIIQVYVRVFKECRRALVIILGA